MEAWYCRDCGQRIDVVERDLGPAEGGRAMVWTSRLTGRYICTATGEEHVSGSAERYAERVQRVLTIVKRLTDDGELTADQGLRAIYIDTGLSERPEGWGTALAETLANVATDW